MKMTVRQLVDLGACSEAVIWAQENYSKGAELTAEVLAEVPNDSWLCWLAGKLSESYRFWCAGVAFREAAKVNPSLAQYSMKVTPENWREARRAAFVAADYAATPSAAADYAATAYAYAAADSVDAAAADYAATAYAAANAAAANNARLRVWAEMRAEAIRVLIAM